MNILDNLIFKLFFVKEKREKVFSNEDFYFEYCGNTNRNH